MINTPACTTCSPGTPVSLRSRDRRQIRRDVKRYKENKYSTLPSAT